MENEAKNDGKNRKIWIIFCLIGFVALVFVMAKFLIINPFSSNEELFSDLKSDLDAKVRSAQTSSASSQQSSTSVNSKPQPTPFLETEMPPETPTADEPKTTDETKTTAAPSQSDKFISASPIKVADIKEISKFRSCAEEAYGETSFQNQKESESSLKHYFDLKNSDTAIYAPFDGEIIYTSSSKIVIEVRPFNGWIMIISGINLKNGLNLGTQIKSGDEIGNSAKGKIEIAVSGFTQSQKDKKYKDYSNQNIDSIFSHLNDSVSKEFSDKSVTTSNIIVTKTDRDSKKCDFQSDNTDDWVKL